MTKITRSLFFFFALGLSSCRFTKEPSEINLKDLYVRQLAKQLIVTAGGPIEYKDITEPRLSWSFSFTEDGEVANFDESNISLAKRYLSRSMHGYFCGIKMESGSFTETSKKYSLSGMYAEEATIVCASKRGNEESGLIVRAICVDAPWDFMHQTSTYVSGKRRLTVSVSCNDKNKK